MLLKENNAMFDRYVKHLKEDISVGGSITYVGILNHEQYEDLYVSTDPRLLKYCEYTDQTSSPIFVVSTDDESANVMYEGSSMEDIIRYVNAEDWGEGSPNFTVESFIEWCKSTYADKDSAQGYFIVERRGDEFNFIAEPSSGSGNVLNQESFDDIKMDDSEYYNSTFGS